MRNWNEKFGYITSEYLIWNWLNFCYKVFSFMLSNIFGVNKSNILLTVLIQIKRVFNWLIMSSTLFKTVILNISFLFSNWWLEANSSKCFLILLCHFNWKWESIPYFLAVSLVLFWNDSKWFLYLFNLF